MCTITTTVQQCLERFRQSQMKLDELTQLGWKDSANSLCERDKKYGTSGLQVPALLQKQTGLDATTPVPSMIGQLLEGLDIVPGISRMPQGTSRPESSHIWLDSVEPQSNTSTSGLESTAERNASPLLNAKPVVPVSFYPSI